MSRRLLFSHIATTFFLISGFIFAGERSSSVRIACIGDSITFGMGIKDRKNNSYPAQLARMLGEGYEVNNYGVSASTLLKKGDKPYWNLPEFKAVQEYKPNIVIIKLGTNDTKPKNWKHKADFKADYVEMVKTFQALESKPDVWISYPVPVFPKENGKWKWGINDNTVKEGVIPIIDNVAKETGAKIINLYEPLTGKAELLPDKVHPNANGAKVIAETIFALISGKALK